MPPTSIDGNEITGATIDGQEVSEITVDGDVVFTAGPDIPDTVDYQVRASDFADPWPFNIGSTSMTVTNLTTDTFSNGEESVAGNGTDAYGTADGPESYGSLETFGIAFTIVVNSISADDMFLASVDPGSSRIQIKDNGNGNGTLQLALSDNGPNFMRTDAETALSAGSEYAIVVNKNGDTASNINWYIDDMTTPEQTTVENNFTRSNYSNSEDFGFYARPDGRDGSVGFYSDIEFGVVEFNSQPYSDQERSEFVNRRSEV